MYKEGQRVEALRYINGGLDGHRWEPATIAYPQSPGDELIRVEFDDGKGDFLEPHEIRPDREELKCEACDRTFVPTIIGQKYCTIACSITQYPIVGYIKIPR